MASVACCSHSPASGPTAYAPSRRWPSLNRVRNPIESAYSRLYVDGLAISERWAVALNGASATPTEAA